MSNLYILRHHGMCDYEDCDGNPTLFTREELFVHKENGDWDDWFEDPDTGVITSTGDEHWKSIGKTIKASPVTESESALDHEQRLNYDPSDLATEYDLVCVPSDPDNLTSFVAEMIEESTKNDLVTKRVDVWRFIQELDKVSNVCVGPDRSVSGYDHGLKAQFMFTPRKAEK
jgi:hypothetical protein